MASVDVYSKTFIDEMLADSVVGASITDGHFLLLLKDGGTIDAGEFFSGIPAGTTAARGTLELATDTETIDGTDSERAVSPLSLSSRTATDARRGLVELATATEVRDGTDAVRAVTPAAHYSAHVIFDRLETDLPSAYPRGVTIQPVTASAWSLNAGSGIILTNYIDLQHTTQTFYANKGSQYGFPFAWSRSYHSSDGGGGWTLWSQQLQMTALVPASFTVTTAHTSYPVGMSRLYYTSATSTSWPFSGSYGEVVTYFDGLDYARQVYTKHVGGNTNTPEVWTRTANGAAGWSAWLVEDNKRPKAQLSGKVTITPTATNTVASLAVTFPTGYFTATPNITISPETTVPGSDVNGWSVSAVSATGFTANVRRTSVSAVSLHWNAVLNN